MKLLPLMLSLVSASPPVALDAGERTPAVAVVLTPTGRAHTSRSRVLEAAASAIEAKTVLDVRSSEQVGIDAEALAACPIEARLTCWLKTIIRTDPQPRPEVLLAISVLSVDKGQDSVQVLAMDVRDGLARMDTSAGDDLEDEIYAQTGNSAPTRVEDEDLFGFFDRLLQSDLQGFFARRDLWGRLGAIDIENADGARIQLDDRVVGLGNTRRTRLTSVRPGSRTLTVIKADTPFTTQVDVRPDETPVIRVPEPATAWPTVGTIAGLSVAVAGAALVGVGVARSSQAEAVCFARDGVSTGCRGLGAPTFGFSPDAAPTSDLSDVNPGGLRITPLGAGVLTAGLVTSAGALFVDEHSVSPWIIIATSVAAGAAVAAVGTVAGAP